MKSTEVKTEETLTLAEQWEKHPPPVPTATTDLAVKSLGARVSGTVTLLAIIVAGQWISSGHARPPAVHVSKAPLQNI